MAQVIVSDPARRDLLDITRYLAQHAGLTTARRYSQRFSGALERLGKAPATGSPRPALGADARVVPIHPYVVVYDYIGGQVVVLRVLHSRRNITRDLVRG